MSNVSRTNHPSQASRQKSDKAVHNFSPSLSHNISFRRVSSAQYSLLRTRTATMESLGNSDDEGERVPLDCLQSEASEASDVQRKIICGDSIEWLNKMGDTTFPAGYCGFTSLPDISELQGMFGPNDIEEYKRWFTDTAALFLSKLPVHSFAVFLQSDIRAIRQNSNEVTQWVDKSHLCSLAADRTGCTMMWHKLVLLHESSPEKRSAARPSYSHLVCYAKQPSNPAASMKAADDTSVETHGHHGLSETDTATLKTITSSPQTTADTVHTPVPVPVTYRTGYFAIPDIFYRGDMIWPKGIGLNCCYAGVAFLAKVAHATCIVDPFAGQGTVVAMANALGVSAIGVEISAKRCKKARSLNVASRLSTIPAYIRNISLEVVAERAAAHANGGVATDNDKGENAGVVSQQHVPRKKNAEVEADSSRNTETITDGGEVEVVAML